VPAAGRRPHRCALKLQLLSDLHLETEAFDPAPAPGAELLVLAGDIDSTWAGLAALCRLAGAGAVVPGNHEFDGRDFDHSRCRRCAARASWASAAAARERVITAADGPAGALRRHGALERLRPLRRRAARTRDACGRVLHALMAATPRRPAL
jgi:hypothetical protein